MSSPAPDVQPPKLLIVDDDPSIVSQLRLALRKEFDVRTASDPDAAWAAVVAERPDLITLDLALDGVNPETGFAVLEKCLTYDPLLKIILITGNDNDENGQRAIGRGAADFLGKPVNVESLRVMLHRHASVARLERLNAAHLKQLPEEQRFGGLVGKSPAMRAVYQRIRKVAPVDVEVLILGASGTGKEVVAREISRLSRRASKPFQKIDLAAIPPTLVESELFGNERGAFTDARERRLGRLEIANGGTVFLDEIGELPVLLQVKLLRFLQEHMIERVGGREVIKLDVRVVAATSRDLEAEIKAGRFRQDLYYRLSVVEIKMPPLHERGEDLVLLAQYFLDLSSDEFGRGKLSFSTKALRAIQQHPWVGNVRELENKIRGAVALSSGRTVDNVDLGLESGEPARPVTLREATQEAERHAIGDALRITGGNVSRAAELLGIARPSLYEKMEKLGIDPRKFKLRARLAME